MISKQAFVQLMKSIQEHREKLDKISDFLENQIISGWALINSPIVTSIVDALQKDLHCEDKFGGEISWWLYEFDRDEKREKTYTDGTVRDVTKLEDFYDYLVETFDIATSGFIQPINTVFELPSETTTNATEIRDLNEIIEEYKQGE